MITAFASLGTPPADNNGVIFALIVFILLVAGWVFLRRVMRSMQANKTQSVVGSAFADYAREALVNAAKIDGRVNDEERVAISRAMSEFAGADHDEARIVEAFAKARLNKDELVAYLRSRAGSFSRDQKTALLKALLSVFVADGKFDEVEHGALVDYTAAIGFDRQSAPDTLRGIARSFQRGSIT